MRMILQFFKNILHNHRLKDSYIIYKRGVCVCVGGGGGGGRYFLVKKVTVINYNRIQQITKYMMSH